MLHEGVLEPAEAVDFNARPLARSYARGGGGDTHRQDVPRRECHELGDVGQKLAHAIGEGAKSAGHAIADTSKRGYHATKKWVTGKE